MKLIFCKQCHDVLRLFSYDRKCACGKSGGYYLDNINAVYYGTAVPLGFDNRTLSAAVANQPAGGMGACFVSFVIPVVCDTFRKK